MRALAPIGPAGAEAAAAAVAATLAAVAAAAAEGKGWPFPPSDPRRCADDGLGETAVSRLALASRAALLMLLTDCRRRVSQTDRRTEANGADAIRWL